MNEDERLGEALEAIRQSLLNDAISELESTASILREDIPEGIPDHGYIDTSQLTVTPDNISYSMIDADGDRHSINIDNRNVIFNYGDTAHVSLLDLEMERRIDREIEEFEHNGLTVRGTRGSTHFDLDYIAPNFNLDRDYEISSGYTFNTTHLEPRIRTNPWESFGSDSPFVTLDDYVTARHGTFGSDKALVIEQFNKKCENCDKEECVVINCFMEFLFDNYHVIRK